MLFMAEICIVSLILHGLFLFAWFLGTVLAPDTSLNQTESCKCFAQLIFVALFHSWKNSSNVRYRSALLQLTALDAT